LFFLNPFQKSFQGDSGVLLFAMLSFTFVLHFSDVKL
jgi:hypothetical protein